jgi:hypothetical protein
MQPARQRVDDLDERQILALAISSERTTRRLRADLAAAAAGHADRAAALAAEHLPAEARAAEDSEAHAGSS